MAFDLRKLDKYGFMLALYAFYAQYAKTHPTDPFGAMWADIQSLTDVSTLLTRIKAKMNEVYTLIIMIVIVPLLMKSLGAKVPSYLKTIVNFVRLYFIGDSLAKILDSMYVSTTAGGYGGSNSFRGGAVSWGGESNAKIMGQYSAPQGYISSNIYGG